jgi:hypothetical protein
MTFEERSNLVLSVAQLLYINGQSTDQTLLATERFGHVLGLRATLNPRWGELQLHAHAETGEAISLEVAADPVSVHMARVASAMQVINQVASGQLAPAGARDRISAISKAPPAPRLRPNRASNSTRFPTRYRCFCCNPSFNITRTWAEARSEPSFSDSERRWSSSFTANSAGKSSMNIAGLVN